MSPPSNGAIHGEGAAILSGQPCVLLAEDDHADLFFFRRALRACAIQTNLCVARDGENAIEYLRGDGCYSDRKLYPLPVLIVTDLKMPRVTGFELLAWLRQNSCVGHIPVIVLSGSEIPADKARARELGAVDYVVKDASVQGVAALARCLEQWLGRPVKGGGLAAA